MLSRRDSGVVSAVGVFARRERVLAGDVGGRAASDGVVVVVEGVEETATVGLAEASTWAARTRSTMPRDWRVETLRVDEGLECFELTPFSWRTKEECIDTRGRCRR